MTYYNPRCVNYAGENFWTPSVKFMCVNFVYDLNGSKGPNIVGKDIGFMSALYPTDSGVVAPVPLPHEAVRSPNFAKMGESCMKLDSASRVPNKDELLSMFYNKFHTVKDIHS